MLKEKEDKMLSKLLELLPTIPLLLQDIDRWHAVKVVYHPPIVWRLWTQINDNRLYLHKIEPCNSSEALFHPHPWPSAIYILDGDYEMKIGYSCDDKPPPIAATLVLSKNSSYEMMDSNGWHSVRPIIKSSLSIMLAGKPWHKSKKQDGELMQNLCESDKSALFDTFRTKIYELGK